MAFARAELSRYAALMDPRYNASQVEMIPFAEAELLANGVRDPYWDDAYRIDVINGRASSLIPTREVPFWAFIDCCTRPDAHSFGPAHWARSFRAGRWTP